MNVLTKEKNFFEKPEKLVNVKLIGYKSTPYSKIVKYLIIEIDNKVILTSKPINAAVEDRFYNADNFGDVLAALYFYNKIKNDDKKIFNILKNLYY